MLSNVQLSFRKKTGAYPCSVISTSIFRPIPAHDLWSSSTIIIYHLKVSCSLILCPFFLATPYIWNSLPQQACNATPPPNPTSRCSFSNAPWNWPYRCATQPITCSSPFPLVFTLHPSLCWLPLFLRTETYFSYFSFFSICKRATHHWRHYTSYNYYCCYLSITIWICRRSVAWNANGTLFPHCPCLLCP